MLALIPNLRIILLAKNINNSERSIAHFVLAHKLMSDPMAHESASNRKVFHISTVTNVAKIHFELTTD